MTAQLEVFETADATAEHVAGWLTELARKADGVFAVALAGGSTPKLAYEKIAARQDFPWSSTNWFFGDERFVPLDDPRSNYRMAREAFLTHAPPANVHPVPTDLSDAVAAAAAYEMHLKAFFGTAKPVFDVALLGLGTDGHTASLFPGDAALWRKQHWVSAAKIDSTEPRITLTYPALNASRHIAFLVTGAEKRTMLTRLLRADKEIPAGAIAPAGSFYVFADKAAAGRF